MISQEERQRTVVSLLGSSLDPSMNAAFAIKNQEEHQRSVGFTSGLGIDQSINTTFVAKPPASSYGKNKMQRKERPYCTKCEINGHTIETYYKIHGYPPGYKKQPKPRPGNTSTVNINQVSGHSDKNSDGSTGIFFQTLSKEQINQLMKMFSTHLASSPLSNDVTDRYMFLNITRHSQQVHVSQYP